MAPQIGYRPGLGHALWSLLRRFRLGRLALILQPWLWQRDIQFTPQQLASMRQQGDAILTVAHGLSWLQAMAAASSSRLPLITISHDWYPDASGCPRWGLWIWEHYFRQLFQHSALVLAVSEGMAHEIGTHPNLNVLLPIPDPDLQPCPPRQPQQGPWRLYYSGLCGGLYSSLLNKLIDAVASDRCFALHCSGPDAPTLPMPASQPRLRSSGFLHGDSWQQAFDEADVLVLVLSFELRHRRHLATHFPSKLVEYANRGRPIVIWGPLWSSAVQWGQDQPSVLCFCSKSAQALLRQLSAWLPQQPLRTDPDKQLSAACLATQFNHAVAFTLQAAASAQT